MDRNRFIILTEASEGTLYRVAKSILPNDCDVEDAVQEGLLKAYQKKDTLKDESKFRPWLTRIVINECYALLRKRKPTAAFEEAYAVAESVSDYSELYESLRNLPVKIRITVTLYYVEGYQVAEIAEILKIPQGTVKSRLSKGRKLLKAALETKGDYYERKPLAKSLS